MQTDRPDDATGDSVTLARVYAFLAALLAFLGFGVAPDESVSTALDKLFVWLDGASKIRRDPQGATARIWWDMFKAVMLESRGKKEYAAQLADESVDEFGKRFLPVADDERDTLNTGDLDAMRAELDEADRYRQEICDALDGVTAPRRFVHAQIVDELRAEREALLVANKHHASEIETLRGQRQKDLAEMAQLANALDGVRAAILAPSLPDGDVPGVIRQIVEERNGLHIAICDASGMPHTQRFDRIASVAALRTERDALKAKLASAIVPLPKPERVEPGQRWARISATYGNESVGTLINGVPARNFMIDHSDWIYIGTEAK